MRIKIDRVVDTKRPFTPKGKDYTIYEFVVDGEVDGRPERDFTVKTMSERMAKQIRDGWEGDAKEDEYQGNISYRIFAPKDDDRRGPSGPGPSSGGGQDDSMKLQCFSLSYAKDLVAPMISAGILKTPEEIAEVWSMLSDKGLTWLRARRNIAEKPAEDWMNIITRHKLEESVRGAGIKRSALERIWANSNNDSAEFIKHLKAVLDGDDLPF